MRIRLAIDFIPKVLCLSGNCTVETVSFECLENSHLIYALIKQSP